MDERVSLISFMKLKISIMKQIPIRHESIMANVTETKRNDAFFIRTPRIYCKTVVWSVLDFLMITSSNQNN